MTLWDRLILTPAPTPAPTPVTAVPAKRVTTQTLTDKHELAKTKKARHNAARSCQADYASNKELQDLIKGTGALLKVQYSTVNLYPNIDERTGRVGEHTTERRNNIVHDGERERESDVVRAKGPASERCPWSMSSRGARWG